MIGTKSGRLVLAAGLMGLLTSATYAQDVTTSDTTNNQDQSFTGTAAGGEDGEGGGDGEGDGGGGGEGDAEGVAVRSDDERGEPRERRGDRRHREARDRNRSDTAQFHFQRGDQRIEIRCATKDSTDDCVEAVLPLVQLLTSGAMFAAEGDSSTGGAGKTTGVGLGGTQSAPGSVNQSGSTQGAPAQ